MDRDELRKRLVDRQGGICIICGRGMYGDAHVHEAIIKRGDLPGDSRIFAEWNCVAVHGQCHENTKRIDEGCIAFLVGYYGEKILEYIEDLGMKVEGPRVAFVKEMLELRRKLKNENSSNSRYTPGRLLIPNTQPHYQVYGPNRRHR